MDCGLWANCAIGKGEGAFDVDVFPFKRELFVKLSSKVSTVVPFVENVLHMVTASPGSRRGEDNEVEDLSDETGSQTSSGPLKHTALSLELGSGDTLALLGNGRCDDRIAIDPRLEFKAAAGSGGGGGGLSVGLVRFMDR